MQSPRPNIVLIMADDLGYSDLGCYGGEIATPHIDRLAAEGVRFRRAYNNAVCNPTRASLLTGLYPDEARDRRGWLRPEGTATLAEVLSGAGYRTYMSGKWHNGHEASYLPVDRGFDRHWGLVSGGCNYFNPGLQRPGEVAPALKLDGDYRPWADGHEVVTPYTPEDPGFYITDAFTDRAVDWLRHDDGDEQPFFLYVAYTAPHFPLQAPAEDIEKYRGKYLDGWDTLRSHRYERLTGSGVIDQACQLSPRDPRAPAWAGVKNKAEWDLRMAVHAAMVDRLDQGVGRIMETVRALGQEQETVFIFLSDNGACGEPWHATPEIAPGPMESYRTFDPPWANLSNTPFRLFKVFEHEGGIATPFIVRWLGGMQAGGGFCDSVVHVMDLLPTFLELAGGVYPAERLGVATQPLRGRSFAAALTEGADADLGERGPLYWDHDGARAVLFDSWKLVTEGPQRVQNGVPVLGDSGWELYNIEEDRSEVNNLAATELNRVRELKNLWESWRVATTSSA